jgi:RHS repeat-associated protein
VRTASTRRTALHSRHSVSIFSLLFSVAAAALFSAAAGATVYSTGAAGRTRGSFAVSPMGAATYTIPIWAPSGPRGLQPNIALAYNSQVADAGDPAPAPGRSQTPGRPIPVSSTQASLNWTEASTGYLGVGWSVQGLSSIYRCNLTFAQDAAPAPIALATSDGYCMDGQRLRLTSGTYGEAGSIYQTEVANFVTVTAYGTAGNGPSYWIVQDRNGRTYFYGDGNSSQVIANGTSTAVSWMLNQISDPYGNSLTISYLTTNATSAVVPSVISWTPASHGSSTYNYTMTFTYNTNGTNAPQSSIYKYIAGSPVTNTNLLSSIAIAYSGTVVKTYYLTYQASPTTQREELTDVQECSGSSTSSCLAPTVMTYQSGEAGTATSATSALSSAPSQLIPADFNGDGLTDLAYCNGSTMYVSFASTSGYGTPINTGAACGALVGDLLGQGRQGLLANNSGTWYYYTWNGSAFTATSTELAYDSTAAEFVLDDVNGDGLPDLVSLYVTNGTTVTVYARLNASSGTTPSFSTTNTNAYSQSGQFTGAEIAGSNLDFNGDGRKDIVLEVMNQGSPHGTADAYELISTSTAFTATLIESKAGAYPVMAFLNFNSDACTDYLSYSTNTIFVSGCNGSLPTTVTVPSGTIIGAMDWNGDGRTDILVENGSTIGVYLSNGNAVSSTLVTTSVPYNAGNQYFTFNANGDGLDDLGVWNQTSFAVSYFSHNSAGKPPDLLASVTDGFGNSASPTYISLVQGDYASTGYGTAPAGYQTFMAPLYVVNEAVYSDPTSSSGGTYYQTFGYYEAWTNIQGRGFQAFYATTDWDSRNQLEDTQYFERSFPYTGMKAADTITGTTLTFEPSYTNATLAPLVTLSSTPYQERYFAYFSNVTNQRREVGGVENGALITTTSTTYSLDDYGNPTSITQTVTDNDPDSAYVNDYWTTTMTNTFSESSPPCVSLLSTSQVQYTASTTPASASVTTTQTFTPNTSGCNYTQIVTQSNSGASYAVTEALAYDAFGNVNSDTVTGANMTGRLTTANWGTTGQFSMSVTDPTSATTQFNYNFNYGERSSATDPNGLTTSWQYDGFGRKSQETRPDGTYTTWTYYNCASYVGCPLGSGTYGLNILHDVYNTNATVQSSGVDFRDAVGRELVNLQMMMNGSTYSRNEQRYNSLGLVSQKAFPCTYTAITTPCSYWTTNTYDLLDRLTQSQRPISSTNSTLQTTSYAYAGRTTTITDPLSNTRNLIHDVNGWLRQTRDAYPYYYLVTLAYDAAGNKTAVTDNSNNSLWSATYNYGAAAFPATITDMDLGKWSYTYDALGELTGWTDAKSQSFSETYDALSRPLTRSEPDLFTQWTWGSSASSHNIGRLQSACTGTGSSPTSCTGNPGYAESETYDSLSRLSQRTITLPGANGTFTYALAYNATTGLLNTLTYPASYPSTYSLELQYAYSEGYLQSVTDISDTPNVTVWTNDAMNPAGQVTDETLGNGIETNRTYDAVTGWLGTDESGVGGGSGVKNLAFLYDEMGDVTQRQDNNLGLTENGYYDNDYRLTSTTLNGTQNLSVTYDNTMGNITSRSDVAAGAAWTYSSTQKHAVTQAGSSAFNYTYDANGNATARQGNSITWSSYNYPVTVNAGSGATAETVAFSYGPDRSRWQQMYTGNGTSETTNYVGGLMEVVSSGSTTTYRHYIYAGGEPVAVYARSSAGNTFSYVLADHQGSTSDLTNSSGTSIVNESFTPFGQRRNPTTWSGAASNSDLTTAAGITRQAYTFQTQLGLWMGMNHMNGRVEDSITGRMLSADSYIPDPTNGQSYNRFSYVNNNPLTRTDPTGFDDCDQCTLPYDPCDDPAACSDGSASVNAVSYCPSGTVCINGTPWQGGNPGDITSWLPFYDLTWEPWEDQQGFLGPVVTVTTSKNPPAQFNPQVTNQCPYLFCSLNQDPLEEVVVTAKPQGNPTQCGAPSVLPHGIGLSVGANAEAGVPWLLGAGGNGSVGGGAFYSSTTGVSTGGFASGGATGYAGGSSIGAPSQSSAPWVLGASAGGGASLFLTNAQSVQQLSGPFSTYSLNVGFGPAQFSAQLAVGGGIWQLSVSPPFAGATFGGSASQITTNTATTSGGCH